MRTRVEAVDSVLRPIAEALGAGFKPGSVKAPRRQAKRPEPKQRSATERGAQRDAKLLAALTTGRVPVRVVRVSGGDSG